MSIVSQTFKYSIPCYIIVIGENSKTYFEFGIVNIKDICTIDFDILYEFKDKAVAKLFMFAIWIIMNATLKIDSLASKL